MGCDCGDKLDGVTSTLSQITRVLETRLLHQEQAPIEQYVQTIPIPAVTKADANGNAVASYGPPRAGQKWYVEFVSKHAPHAVVLEVLVGPQGVTDPAYRRLWSPSSVDDIASGLPGVCVNPGDYLVLSWSGGTASDILTASLQVRVVKVGRPQAVSAAAVA